MMIKGIIFDCDGVLLDSEPLFAKATQVMMDAYGLNLDLSGLPDGNGVTVTHFCRILLEHFPHIGYSLEKLVKDYYYYSDLLLMADDLKPMEGIQDFCREQHEKGLQLSVASSSPTYYVTHKLRLFGIEPYFDRIISADDITHSKPHPEIYLKAIEKSGLEKRELIAIEDAPNGIKAAKAAGLYVVGFKGSAITQDTSQADEEAFRFKDIQILKEGI
jgi:HAD superfamily hydrolase (TIGR01509 family)